MLDAPAPTAPAIMTDGGSTGSKKQLLPPAFAGLTPPKQLWHSRRFGDVVIPQKFGKPKKGVLHVCGIGCKTAEVMFISPSVYREEEMTMYSSDPAMLNGPAGALFRRFLSRCGFRDEDWYYTALCKYNVPRLKPGAQDIRWNEAVLDDEIRTIKPKLIVCLGKVPFDHIFRTKFKLHEIQGGFFRSETYDCLLYPMDTLLTPLMRPEYQERMLIDLKAVRRCLDEIRGFPVVKVETNYVTIDTAEKLQNCMTELRADIEADRVKMSAIDCEWKGKTAWSGQLRLFQLSWRAGQAVAVRLGAPLNGKFQYVFDQPLEVVREIIKPTMDHPKLKYIGHNAHADMAWMSEHLELKTFGRFGFDTMFAQQLLNEYSELKLERLAVQHTDLGRYDIELLLWKKKVKFDEDDNEGYGMVPDSIIIPYSCLHGESLVQLADGTWEQIKSLVGRKYAGKVKALEDGRVVDRAVTNWHRAAVRQKEWFKLKTDSTKHGRWGILGPIFTPDHKILTQRGLVRVDQLQLGVDAIATDERAFSGDQLSVFLGTALGDGGFKSRNDVEMGFGFGQCTERAAYVDWKASVFDNLAPFRRYQRPTMVSMESGYSKYVKSLSLRFPRQTVENNTDRKLVINDNLLAHLGMLGLAVWYQDDGTFTEDHMARIYATKLTPEEQACVVKWLTGHFGDGIYYTQKGKFISFTVAATRKLLETITPFMHPVFQYKTNLNIQSPPTVAPSEGVFYEIIREVVPHVVLPSRRGQGVRYCLSVRGAENFLTEAGFVSNCRDTDATIRLYPILLKKLIQEKLGHYYFNYTLPFVTDGFHELMTTGLPTDREYLDQMRETYTHHGGVLLAEFRKALRNEASAILLGRMRRQAEKIGETPAHGTQCFMELVRLSKAGLANEPEMRKLIQSVCPDTIDFVQLLPVYQHWIDSPEFNLSSPDHMRRWLFDVKKFIPIKTTKSAEGIQMAWEKVIKLPPERQSQFTPAADKQTVKVFAAKDKLVAQLEELKSVQNLTKAFLKGPDEKGREQGLHKWIEPDGRVHSNFALTETGRNRTWKPNILNWPKSITVPIEKAFDRINILVVKEDGRHQGLPVEDKQVFDLKLLSNLDAKPKDREEAAKRLMGAGFTQDQLEAFVRLITKPTSIRGAARAPEGCAIIDMDLKTAEVVALGYLSGDENLIKVLTEPDTQFARIDPEIPKKAVRICYNDNVNIVESARDPKLLVALDDPRLLRDANGQIMHPMRDVHWEMAEETADGPREKLDERLYRDGAGKCGNFSIPYGASDALLERMIEAATGIKPPPGTGQKMLDTHAARYPVATEYQRQMELTIENPGFFRAISGRVRHFYFNSLGDLDGMSDYTREGILSPLKRQARNFPMQNIVADSTNRALTRFIKERDAARLQSRIMMLLYDAMTSISTLPQLKQTIPILRDCMTKWCQWTAHGRTFNFDVDVNVGFRWGVKPTKEEKELLKQYL